MAHARKQDRLRISSFFGLGIPAFACGLIGAGLVGKARAMPLVNADNNQHSFNENMRLGNYFDGVRSLVHILTQPF